MPELPEVEICRRNLDRWTRGVAVAGAAVHDPRVLRGADPDAFARAVTGARTGSIRRRGKRILWRLRGGPALCLHLGMTGKWLVRGPGEADPASCRVSLFLDDGRRLCYRDPRLLGRVEVRANEEADSWLRAGLGPDALDEPRDGRVLAAALGSTRRALKVALMDQSVLAGLGNIQAAEVLFAAGIRPDRLPSTLSPAEWERLAAAIPETLALTIGAEDGDEVAYVEEDPSRNPFRVYGRGGSPCPRCGAPLVRGTHGGRRTDWCPVCQS